MHWRWIPLPWGMHAAIVYGVLGAFRLGVLVCNIPPRPGFDDRRLRVKEAAVTSIAAD